MTHIESLKKTVTETIFVEAAPLDVFPLLCPVRETDWIADWQCDMVHSESGVNELHCVFQTCFQPIGAEIWITVRYDPGERIEFVRTGVPWVVHYVITLKAADSGTDITWTMHMVGLNQTGNDHIRGMSDTSFGAMINRLGQALSHYVREGACLKQSTRPDLK